MINSVQVLIEWITSIITCEAGRLHLDRHARRLRHVSQAADFLKPGDVVTVREDTIGELTNPVVAG